MVWTFNLGFGMRSVTGGVHFQPNFLIFLFLTIYLHLSLVTSFQFNCDPIQQCFCHEGIGFDEWEIQCPKGLHEIFDISLKVKPLARSRAHVEIMCNFEKPDMPVQLLEEVNFRKAGVNVTELTIRYCPASTLTNPNMLKTLFEKVHLPLQSIRRFVFRPPSRFSTTFPNDLFKLMPNLEILDLQALNLSRVPDLSELSKLQELVLRDNQISTLPLDTFKFTPKLFHLDLSLNNITDLPENVFPVSLVHLNMARNYIMTISPKTFSNLQHLQVVVLHQNPLTDMSIDAFSAIKSLRYLQMDSTRFIKFPKFQKLPNLLEISISYREIRNEPYPNDSNSSGSREPMKNEFVELKPHVSQMDALTKIIFVNDGLVSFPELENLPNLSLLSLQGNKIKDISQDALKNLPLLKTLNLNSNEIRSLGTIEIPSLTTLDLGNNQLEEVDSSVFSKLRNLKILNLSMNKIQTIHPKAFKFVTELTNLDLSKNLISFEDVKQSDDAMTIETAHDKFLFLEFDYQSPLRFCMKLKTLDLSYNSIRTMFDDWSILFGNLKILNLRHNLISYLHASSIASFTSNDLTLDLRENNISRISMKLADVIITDAHKRILNIILDENPLNCDCHILAFKTFRLKGINFQFSNLSCAEPTWLAGLQFRSVAVTDLICPLGEESGCPNNCECWEIPGNKTIAVDCSYRNLGDSYLPDVTLVKKGLRSYNYTLNLAGNKISFLDPERCLNLSSRILKVDLSKNELTSLLFLNMLINNNVSSFDLAENNFPCEDCDFHKTLRSHFTQVSDYASVSCLLTSNTNSEYGDQSVIRYYVDEYPEDRVCALDMTAQVQAMIVTSSIFLVAVVIFIAIYFRYGWALRAYLYSKGFGCCFGFEDGENEEGKIYDAFISYSHKDEDWVLTQLVKRLEDQDGFRLCLHFRDWTPGDWIPDQIVQSVDKSRRTVIILSKHFVDSVWSRLEFKAAHAQALTDKAARLILIMMDDDLKDKDVKDDDLRVYMKMNTYLKYNDPWFWHKLKYALPHKKPPSSEDAALKLQQRERAIKLDKLRAKMENTIT